MSLYVFIELYVFGPMSFKEFVSKSCSRLYVAQLSLEQGMEDSYRDMSLAWHSTPARVNYEELL